MWFILAHGWYCSIGNFFEMLNMFNVRRYRSFMNFFIQNSISKQKRHYLSDNLILCMGKSLKMTFLCLARIKIFVLTILSDRQPQGFSTTPHFPRSEREKGQKFMDERSVSDQDTTLPLNIERSSIYQPFDFKQLSIECSYCTMSTNDFFSDGTS